MVAGCGMTCIKYVVFFVNFLFFAMGCAAVGLGIWALVSDDNMEALTKIDKDGKADDFNAYAGIVVLIIIVEIVAAALAIAFKSDVEDYLQDGLKKGIGRYYDGYVNSSNPFSRAIDFAQVEFMCCGVTNYTDFHNSPWYNNTHKGTPPPPAPFYPESCCEQADRNKYFDDNKLEPKDSACPSADPSANKRFIHTSCYDSIQDWVDNYAAIIIGIAFGIVAIEILAVVFACCLYRSIDD
ncbi:hypothetical protein BaRGS_00027860 [Batillaria attramentaria]|uniref:Tetraspanin n=1 Tax=Batillaria attramentaria TaxID=370345 RepID=A0ABD0K0K7_9CAEN